MIRTLLFFGFLLPLAVLSQQSTYQEFGPVGPISRPVDIIQMSDGSYLCLATSLDVLYPPYNNATHLIHLSPSGDSLRKVDIGNSKTQIQFIGFVTINKIIFLQAFITRDSVIPYQSKTGVKLQRYTVELSTMRITLSSELTMETAFSVFNHEFKALNWYYHPALSYDAEICKIDADSGSGFKINEPGFVTIKQLISCKDGSLYALGDVWYRDKGDNMDLFILKLDKNLHLLWKQTYGKTKGSNPSPYVRPGSERPNYFVHKKIVNGDTIDELEFRMVADTLTNHSVEIFKSGCIQKDNSIIVLSGVSLASKYSEHIYLLRIDPGGEVMWEYLTVDTAIYERGTRMISTRSGVIVFGDKTSSLNPQHSEVFTKSFNSDGELKTQSEHLLPDRWLISGQICRTKKGYAVCGYQFDALRNPTCHMFFVGVTKKGLLN